MFLNEDWWAESKYVVSFICPIVELIRYADPDSPGLGEIYEWMDCMVGKVRHIICQRNPSLEFFQEIHKTIEKRWSKLNTSLHMAAYALNPKWYMERPNRVLHIDDEEVKYGFLDSISKMYTLDEENFMWEQFIDFGTLNPLLSLNMQRGKARFMHKRIPLDGGECMAGKFQSFDILPYVCYLKLLVPQQLKGIGPLIVSSTLLRGIGLLLRKQRNWFMCIVVFDFFHGSYLST